MVGTVGLQKVDGGLEQMRPCPSEPELGLHVSSSGQTPGLGWCGNRAPGKGTAHGPGGRRSNGRMGAGHSRQRHGVSVCLLAAVDGLTESRRWAVVPDDC
jgi:hypothetical protein